jgi:hypothetical protein
MILRSVPARLLAVDDDPGVLGLRLGSVFFHGLSHEGDQLSEPFHAHGHAVLLPQACQRAPLRGPAYCLIARDTFE